MIKKKQHFVSQFYLKNWAGKDDRLFALINNNVMPMKTREVAHSNYFYKVDGVNDDERAFLLKEVSSLAEPIKSMISGLINSFHIIHKFSIDVNGETEESRIIKTNAIEDVYCIVEELALPSLDIIKKEEYGEIDIFGYSYVVRYINFQLARTPAVKNKIKNSTESLLRDKNIRFDSYYMIYSLIIAERISLQLINKLYKLVVINNKTNINLITNDNPVKNLNPIDKVEVKLFLPLSPKQGLLLEPSELPDEKVKTPLEDLSKSQYYLSVTDCYDQDYISKLNLITWNNKERSAFSYKESDLKILIS
ncbi:DUF4238 domain-containing protein [Oceanospirillum sp.]|uniref:DUF4238 domain-containing protein n=1 Tax=Oceanospirillum sp. TaxID=2021254 RepID=UPI003A929421